MGSVCQRRSAPKKRFKSSAAFAMTRWSPGLDFASANVMSVVLSGLRKKRPALSSMKSSEFTLVTRLGADWSTAPRSRSTRWSLRYSPHVA